MIQQCIFNSNTPVCVVVQNVFVQEGMEKCKADWEDFLKEQARLKEAVDEEHVKAVGRLSTQYSEMKKDLDKFSQF